MITRAADPATSTGATVSRIVEEFRQMPGLRLTSPQVRRLWHLSDAECEALLERLTACGMLRQDVSGRYVRVEPRQ